jgi:hypothetical protein
VQDICDCWDEFFKVLQIEMDESAKDSQRVSKQAMINFEGSSEPCLAKKPRKEKTKAKKKKKILTKLVVGKDEKRFDATKC